MPVDFVWMSEGGLLLDAYGDIAVTSAVNNDSTIDMVKTRLKAALNGWQLYAIGADLQSRIGQWADPEIELRIQRQTVAALAGMIMQNATETVTVPLVTYQPDDFWTWRPLADLAAQINQSRTFSAAVLQSGFSYQLAWQSNRTYVTGEAIAGQTVKLAHPGVVNLVFSTAVPAYTLGTDNQTLHFASPLPSGCTVSYSYQQCPWNLVTSPIGLISLLDPALPQVALAPSGAIAYQVREYLQAVAISDSSYWAG